MPAAPPGQEIVEYPADLAGDLGVRAEENAQQIAAADDAKQLALGVGDRQEPHMMVVHEPGRRRDRRVRADRDGGGGHQILRHGAVMPVPPPRPAQPPPACRRVLVPRGQQVTLGDDPDNVPSHGEHRYAADLVLGQPPLRSPCTG
jgi:hypothetical protein